MNNFWRIILIYLKLLSPTILPTVKRLPVFTVVQRQLIAISSFCNDPQETRSSPVRGRPLLACPRFAPRRLARLLGWRNSPVGLAPLPRDSHYLYGKSAGCHLPARSACINCACLLFIVTQHILCFCVTCH